MYKNNNHSHQYFKNMKDFLEAQKTKAASVMYRKKLKEHQDKTNYTNEEVSCLEMIHDYQQELLKHYKIECRS